MDSPENAAQFLESLETLIALFEDQASSPLSGWQKRQLHAWNALLKENGPVKRSRTRTHVRMHARKTAFKVKKTAGSETVLLFMLRYSISSCPKITYHGFYQELHEWSCRTNFPKLLEEEASQIWEEPSPSTRHALPNQQVPLHYEARSQQQFDAEDNSSTRTSPDALIPSTSFGSKADQSVNYRVVNDQLTAEQQNGARFHYYESAYSGSSANMYNRTESQMGGERGIEVAFDVPSNILDTFVELHKRSEHSQGHSAILTIPTQQDRVASLVLSISRSEAVANGGKHDLTEIFNAGFPTSSAEHDLPEMFNSGSPSA
ncbi:hypothetical protein PENARI_c073G08411 [Penicillium arizonense]|uniref:Uncharacterized protein n=1 Tax=Penicillium arizonense TaxID=1835702 RepID=A0A1F5L1D8_PENAI|nr:hypothetical protein PENARI_c073G08411 [Penicillium arizonense]OGE47033.1 hypothetical protein PENARI_c073G08411 [Penicillium arizonense]